MSIGFRVVKLGEVASFVRGITFKPTDVVPVGTPGSVLCMRTKNVQSVLDLTDVWAVDASLVRRQEQFLRRGDTLVSSANSWNLVGKCSWIPEMGSPASFGGFVSVLRPDSSNLNPRYLYHWFSYPRTQAMVRSFGRRTTNISNLNFDRCLTLDLPLPPIEEQERVAELLDKADELRAKRREVLTSLGGLQRAVFLDMFGDPVLNSRRWPRVTLGSLLSEIQSGHSPQCLDRPALAGEWAVLKLGAVSKCEYDQLQNKALPAGVTPNKEDEVQVGDLLFSRKNTPDLIAACVLIRKTAPRLLMPDLIFRLKLAPGAEVDAAFLHQLLIFPTKRRKIQSLAGGSAGSMPNISKAKLRDVEVELPPLDLQREFAARSNLIESAVAAHRTGLAELDALFASLQERAFRGAL
ncbi:restriction endonuclease subunit S [Micromonospora tulbaghiae]|uniref:restriction endonuclease subunit S n=1 Tax=Micromonospora tulbaghiae TaxID=479978 RepID=UPI0033D8D6FE